MGRRQRDAHTGSGVGGGQHVYLQRIAIRKQVLKPTSWISNAIARGWGSPGGGGQSGSVLAPASFLWNPSLKPHGRFETGVTERARAHTA